MAFYMNEAGAADFWAKVKEKFSRLKTPILWENASPSSTFEAQTISLDLSAYDSVAIVFCVNGENEYRTDNIFCYQKGAVKSANIMKTGRATDYQYFRAVSVAEDGVTFDLGIEAHFSTSGSAYSRTQTAAYAIPIRIYGIEGAFS